MTASSRILFASVSRNPRCEEILVLYTSMTMSPEELRRLPPHESGISGRISNKLGIAEQPWRLQSDERSANCGDVNESRVGDGTETMRAK